MHETRRWSGGSCQAKSRPVGAGCSSYLLPKGGFLLPTVAQPRAAQKSLLTPDAGVSPATASPLPSRQVRHVRPGVLPPARRSTAARLQLEAARKDHQPRGSGISAGDVPAHVRAVLPTWGSRRAYLRLIKRVAKRPECHRLCRQLGLAVDTFVHVMTAAAIAADGSTGMLWASQHVVAAAVNRQDKVVQRALRVAAACCLATEVYRGRELGKEERLTLVEQHGRHPQRGIPSGWQLAFIPPRTAARFSTASPGRFCSVQPFVHLPPEGGHGLHTHHIWTTLCAENGEQNDAASRRQQPRLGRRHDPGAYSLARQLIRAVPWLAGERPGRLAGALTRFATCSPAWTAPMIVAEIDTAVRRRGHDPARLTADRIRTRPAVVLAAILRDVHEVADHHHPTHGGWAAAEYVDTRPVCDRDDCDHGWLTTTDPDTGWSTTIWPDGAAHKCPARHPASFDIEQELDTGTVVVDPSDPSWEPPF